MEHLLEQINETFDNCMGNCSEETRLQLKIIKNNINTLFQQYQQTEVVVPQEVPASGKKKILVVDDSSIVRNYLDKLLSESYDIVMATDGQDAIDKLGTEEDIHAMLLDLMMPNVDGFGVLDYLAQQNSSIPVIIISGDNTKETINRAFEYHVVDIIEKPFDAKTIQSKIERVIL